MLACNLVLVAVHHALAVLCREFCLGNTFKNLFGLLAVFNEILDGNQGHAPFLCLLLKFRKAGHGSVVAHDFAAKACFLKSCKTA